MCCSSCLCMSLQGIRLGHLRIARTALNLIESDYSRLCNQQPSRL